MANIKTIIDYPIADGSEITFRSPLDYHNITGLTVCYPDADGNETSKNFTFVDAHRNDVTQLSDLFTQGAIVKVILDYTNGLAFIQNADTNSYLEGKFSRVLFIKGEGEDGEEVELLPEPIYEDQKGAPGGVAPLDEDGKVPVEMIPTPDVHEQINIHNISEEAHTDIRKSISDHIDVNNPHGITPSMINAEYHSNPNLLDNWYFADPIDQRIGYIVPQGTAYYSEQTLINSPGTISENFYPVHYVNETYGLLIFSNNIAYVKRSDMVRGYTGEGYTIDRWRSDRSPVLVVENGIKLYVTQGVGEDYIWQTIDVPVECLIGMTVCMSAIVNGELYSGSTVFIKDKDSYADWECPLFLWYQYASLRIQKTPDGSFRAIVAINESNVNESIVITAVKLEPGTEQTLAHKDGVDENGNPIWVLNDAPPSKEIELLKCIQSKADPNDTYANKVIATGYPCNDNLLDNWYFGNPINQRNGYIFDTNTYPALNTSTGEDTWEYLNIGYVTVDNLIPDSEGTGIHAVFTYNDIVYYGQTNMHTHGYKSSGIDSYLFDRWKLNYAMHGNITIILGETDIELISDVTYGGIAQFSEVMELEPGPITFSLLTNGGDYNDWYIDIHVTRSSDNRTIIGSTNFDIGNKLGINSVTVNIPEADKYFLKCFICRRNNSDKTIKIKAAKLEMGSTQTLAHQDADGNWVLNEIPDYALELAKCQRYQFALMGEEIDDHSFAGFAIATAQSAANIAVVTPVVMRARPNIVSSNICLQELKNGNIAYPVTAVVVRMSGNVLKLKLTCTDGNVLEDGKFYALGKIGGNLLFDANL